MRILAAFVATAIAAQAQTGAAPFAAFDLASEPVLNDPHDLAMGPDGNIYVADKFGDRIVVMDPETLAVLDVIGAGQLPGVHDVSFSGDGRLAVAVTGAGLVAVYDDVGDIGGQPAAVFAAPRAEGTLLHSSGRLFVMASAVGVLAAFDGAELVATAEGHLAAHDIAEDGDGNIWLADNAARRLVKYSPDLVRLGEISHPRFGLIGPRYLDVDEFGRLVVADQDAHRVLLIDPDGPDGGTLLGVLGDGIPGIGAGRFDDPEGVLVVGPRYYISDSDNNRVVRYSVVLN